MSPLPPEDAPGASRPMPAGSPAPSGPAAPPSTTKPAADPPAVRAASTAAPDVERSLLVQLLQDMLTERRRARRWRLLTRLAGIVLAVGAVLLASGLWSTRTAESDGIDAIGAADRHTALIDLRGVIDADGPASARLVNPALRRAFRNPRAAAVVLRINSGGGSPVQSGLIADEITRLRRSNPDKPVYAVVEDICASGAYYVAAAADQIVVDKASIVGSIGVLMDGWGFTGLMDKAGIERRLLTAGEHKGMLDPFSPLKPDDRARAQSMLDDIHRQFIDVVRHGRGDRLHEAGNPDLFSGAFWTGERSVALGLSDRIGSVRDVAERLDAPVIVDYTRRASPLDKLVQQLGTSIGQSFARALGTAAVESAGPRL